MKLFLTKSTLLCLLLSSAEGFVSPSSFSSLSSSSKQTSALALASRAEEAALQARQRAEAAFKKPEMPKLFDDDLLTDMQESLLKLERRVKDGPGALSRLEVEEFDFATRRILEEMKRNEHNRPKPAPAFPDVVVEEEKGPATKAPTPPQQTVTASMAGISDTDHNPEEGASFDGTNGFGLAQGTTNTYVIPGMDEMSPEEYQKALQKSVSDRQAQRVKSGTYGNKATWGYLDNLGGPSKVKKRWDPNE